MLRLFKSNLVIGLLIWVVACASCPPGVEKAAEAAGENPVVVYVTGHGWHTGLVVPAGDMQVRFSALKTRFGETPFMEFGWGDKDFYQAEEITAIVAVKAVLWPTDAVMHVVAVPADVRTFFPRSEIHRLSLPTARYNALLDFIAGSFRQTDEGAVIPLERGLYGDSSFFDALGHYTLFNTCNTWTAKGLKSAGLDINPATKARASSVMEFLREMEPAADRECGPAATDP
jgi:uncharacterized protein (TIGR02117 family)